ncbi:MAG: hypothetical protein ACQEUZ_14890 [Pseudomonadota bacterium]
MPSTTGSPPASPEARALDARLRALHGTGRAGELSRLHARAAGLLGTPEARRFHLTHAWVFALEAGEDAAALEAALRAAGGFGPPA